MNSADVLTAVSQAALHSAIEFSGRRAATAVIPNGLEPIATQPRPDRYGPPFGLLCVGRLVHGKGFDLAIEALATIRAAGVDAHLTIVGQGEEREQLQDLARRLELDVYVHFMGATQRRETLAAIAQSTLVLVPSREIEGFSLVAAEAALSGVPCVAARVGGLADTVEDGVTGVIVNPENSGDLAAAVVSLLKDEPKMRELAANAWRISPGKFDMRKCAAAYLRLFHEIVDRRRT
jgi:glycosyltransferase involved in cell wall biosynthesis